MKKPIVFIGEIYLRNRSMKIKNIWVLLCLFHGAYGAPYNFSEDDFGEVKWHTASGNSYTIYETFEWTPQSKEKKKPGTLFFIGYQTRVPDKNDKEKFLNEYYDILTHYYYFYLPLERKKMSVEEKKNNHVVMRAFFKVPEEGVQNHSVNFTKNINGVETIVKENKNVENNRLEGLKALNSGQFGDAIKAFEKIESKNAHDYVHWSKAYLYLGKRDEAKDIVQKGLQAHPNYTDLLHAMVSIHIFEGTFVVEGKYEYDPENMKEAKKVLNKILGTNKENLLAQSNLATVETILKNYDEAAKLLQGLMAKSARPWAMQKRLAETFHRAQKFSEAVKYYHMALKDWQGRVPASVKKDQQVKEIEAQLKLAKEAKPLN